jgi:hypothetical protein
MNRRDFLAKGGAAAVGTFGLLARPSWLDASPSNAKTKIHIVYSLHGEVQNVPDWPNKGFDFRPACERINSVLSNQCKNFEFVSSPATGPDQAREILEQDNSANIDCYLVYQMNCWNQEVQTIAASGKPVLYADFHFAGSGGFLVYTAGFLRNSAPNVGFVASSEMKDLVDATKCFEVVKKGGTVSDFVAATSNVRIGRTPKPGLPVSRHDDLMCLATGECLRRLREEKILAVRGQ